MKKILVPAAAIALAAFTFVLTPPGRAQQGASGAKAQTATLPTPPLGDGPWIFDTAEQHKLRVSVVTKGLSHPWNLTFLPGGSTMLVTERSGRIRVIKDGKLDPAPISGVPPVHAVRLSGLMDIALHPKFAQNHWLYLTYTKDMPNEQVSTALVRARLEGSALLDVKELLVTDTWAGDGGSGSRLAFARDGMLFMSTGASNGNAAQEGGSLRGKILRLTDEGKAAPGNPFEGRAGFKPEIYSMGHRNSLALMVHPVTGELWNNENGPNGGDEVNLIKPGKNYGWPVVSYGRDYGGPRISDNPYREGWELPAVFWVPAIAVSGMEVYTGDRFPNWKGNTFVGSMRVGEILGTGHLQRIVFNARNEELRREMLLTELHERIREIRQGPDGLLYLLTDEDNAALLRLEPAN
jgi:glucose/arabinose dehydrogenase